MTDKLRAAAEQALGCLVRAEAMYRQPNAEVQDALRAALAEQPAEQVTNIGCLGMPVNTPVTAPQPTKRPLTDEEIIRAAISTQSAEPGRDGYVLPVTFARAVIAAYEAKNGIGEQK